MVSNTRSVMRADDALASGEDSPRRYSLQPLLDAMGMTLSQAQVPLGIGGPEYKRYTADGMGREVAERKALKAHHHPYEIWPEMADDDLYDAQKECAAEDCHERFTTGYKGGVHRLYCSETCSARVYARRRRKKPKARAAMRRANEAWEQHNREGRNRARRIKYARSPEARRAAAKAYYEANRERVRARQQAARHLAQGRRQEVQEEGQEVGDRRQQTQAVEAA